MQHLKRHWKHYALGAALLLLDQALKAAARTLPLGEKHPLIPGALWWTHVQNTGASFGLFQGGNGALIWVALIILGLLLWQHDHFDHGAERWFYALLLVGLLGNLIDRVRQGHVTDMFDLGWWPVFNVADMALVTGVLGMITAHWTWKHPKRKKS